MQGNWIKTTETAPADMQPVLGLWTAWGCCAQATRAAEFAGRDESGEGSEWRTFRAGDDDGAPVPAPDYWQPFEPPAADDPGSKEELPPVPDAAPTWLVPVVFMERETYRATAIVQAVSAEDAKRRVEAGEYHELDVGKNLGGEGIEELEVDEDREIEAAA